MAKHAKDFEPLDVALSLVMSDLFEASPLSLRAAAKAAGMSHNRLGKIIHLKTPPASTGEIDRVAMALGSSASAVFAAADLRRSEADDYMLAASDPRPDETGPNDEDSATEEGDSA